MCVISHLNQSIGARATRGWRRRVELRSMQEYQRARLLAQRPQSDTASTRGRDQRVAVRRRQPAAVPWQTSWSYSAAPPPSRVAQAPSRHQREENNARPEHRVSRRTARGWTRGTTAVFVPPSTFGGSARETSSNGGGNTALSGSRRAPRRPVRERPGVKHGAHQERCAEHTTDRDRRAATVALSDKTAGTRLLDPAEQKTKGVKSDTPSLIFQGLWTGSGSCARG